MPFDDFESKLSEKADFEWVKNIIKGRATIQELEQIEKVMQLCSEEINKKCSASELNLQIKHLHLQIDEMNK